MELCIGRKCVDAEFVRESTIHCQDLEDTIEYFAGRTKEDSNLLDIVICLRADCHLLECRRPLVAVRSTLGFTEELLDDSNTIELIHPLISVTCFQGPNSSPISPKCKIWYPDPPHSDWTRVRYNTMKEPCWRQQQQKMLWMDLQRTTAEFNCAADCCHFLRSLLGSSHHASPWGENSDEEPYDIVVLVLKQSSDALESFRTTDACPSYFLHSISRLQIPAGDPLWWMHSSRANQLGQTRCDVSLLVFKRLPPRDAYALTNVEDPSASIPDGCLWESYCRQADDCEEDDDDGKIRMQNYWRLVAPPYINHQQDYPNLMKPLLEHLQIILDEALAIPSWPAWPEKNHYSSNRLDPDVPCWTVFPLCHCFPANQVQNKKWIRATCAYAPKTTELLQSLLGDYLRTALFSRLSPETTLEAHTGWEDLANHVYRLHLPLLVPPGGLCGTWVDGVVETHEVGRPLCFDDSKVHRAFNYSHEDRIVLILDIARPSALPIGTATGGHTDELDHFIQSLS